MYKYHVLRVPNLLLYFLFIRTEWVKDQGERFTSITADRKYTKVFNENMFEYSLLYIHTLEYMVSLGRNRYQPLLLVNKPH